MAVSNLQIRGILNNESSDLFSDTIKLVWDDNGVNNFYEAEAFIGPTSFVLDKSLRANTQFSSENIYNLKHSFDEKVLMQVGLEMPFKAFRENKLIGIRSRGYDFPDVSAPVVRRLSIQYRNWQIIRDLEKFNHIIELCEASGQEIFNYVLE